MLPSLLIAGTLFTRCFTAVVAGTVALLLLVLRAGAATEVVRGEFLRTAEVPPADVYDATNANAYVEQGKNNYGFQVRRSAGERARWIGGRVFGQGENRTGGWRVTYDRGNGAGLILHESPGVIVEDFYAEWSWDGIRPARNTSGDILIRRVWLNNIRDDAIESDHLGTWRSVRVEHSLIEDVFVLHSTRRGANATGPTPPHRLEYVGNVISLGLHPMDLEKRQHPWTGPIPGYVAGQMFKSEGGAAAMSLLFRDNVVKLVKAGIVAKSVLRLLPDQAAIDPASGGNTLVWLGGSPEGLEMETIDGVRVPKDFKLDRRLWRVTDDPNVWLEARRKWVATHGKAHGTRVPAAPDTLTAVAAGGGIRLTWSDRSADETGFKIERRAEADGAYAHVASVGANVTRYDDVHATSGAAQHYRVRAFNAAGESAPGGEARVQPATVAK